MFCWLNLESFFDQYLLFENKCYYIGNLYIYMTLNFTVIVVFLLDTVITVANT